MEDDTDATARMGGIKLEDGSANGAEDVAGSIKIPTSHVKDESKSPMPSPGIKSRSESVGTPDSTRPSRSSRKASQQAPKEPVLYSHLPDMTDESCGTFQVIPDCLYGSRHLGSTDNDSLDCDCREEWRE